MTIYEKLLKIQSSISVPKNQHNKFGNYDYRCCEDILSALKPFLEETKCTLTVNDELVLIGERYYIKSTATLIDCESGETIFNESYAREEESKKGMDASQITGTASSYARKYALNGLLLLDDVKDADTDENYRQNQNAKSKKSQQENQNVGGVNKNLKNSASKNVIDKKTVETLRKRFKDNGIDEAKVCSTYKVSELSELSVSQHNNITQYFEKVKEKCTV